MKRETLIFSEDRIHDITRKCLVCGQLEKPNYIYVDNAKPYLCDRCKKALLKVVESEDET